MKPTDTHQPSTARENAVIWQGVSKIEPAGKQPVYNLEVDDYHNFAVNGGVIVHNCMDSLRYFCQTVGIWQKKKRMIA